MCAPSLAVSRETDVAVVGAGAAGLYAALCAAREHASVVLISATPLAQTASYWAQGGLAAALADDDSPELHLRDTELAGRGLVRRAAAEILTHEAPDCVHDLQSLGVRFDADGSGRLALGLEGGHSVRRVVHAGGSATGRRLVRQLSALVAEEPRIVVLERARARALWRVDGRCAGLICEDGRIVAARAIVVGTGGAAAMWARTTNPPGSQGVGLLLAHQAGAELADLELLQFHPTAVIDIAGREGFLVTEAIRGEGATLHDHAGERFVDELLPRDEVSRAIEARLRESGQTSVGLDMRAVDPGHFPNVVAALREAGLDPSRELVPVAPAAHYMMGGIVADLHAQSTLDGLYAVGESSCTGLHGANRLASNSLSECFVFARRAVAHALAQSAPALTPGRRGRIGRTRRAARAARRRRRHAPGAVARRRHRARRRRTLAPARQPPPARTRRRPLRAHTRREPRRAPALRPPQRDPELDGRHVVVAGACAPVGTQPSDDDAELIDERIAWQSWS